MWSSLICWIHQITGCSAGRPQRCKSCPVQRKVGHVCLLQRSASNTTWCTTTRNSSLWWQPGSLQELGLQRARLPWSGWRRNWTCTRLVTAAPHDEQTLYYGKCSASWKPPTPPPPPPRRCRVHPRCHGCGHHNRSRPWQQRNRQDQAMLPSARCKQALAHAPPSSVQAGNGRPHDSLSVLPLEAAAEMATASMHRVLCRGHVGQPGTRHDAATSAW